MKNNKNGEKWWKMMKINEKVMISAEKRWKMVKNVKKYDENRWKLWKTMKNGEKQWKTMKNGLCHLQMNPGAVLMFSWWSA